MSTDVIFYVVFASQILMISYYYPKVVLARINLVINDHPPAEFAKLYTQPFEQLERRLFIFKALHLIILGLGLLIVGWTFKHGLPLTSNQVTVYFMVQFLPYLLLELTCYQQLKLMRAANATSIKKALLKPRKLFDFISPYLLWVAVGLYVVLFALTLSIEGLHMPWYSGYGNLVAITYANIFLATFVFWKLYKSKKHPLADQKDQLKETATIIKVLFFTSIGGTVFTITSVLLNQFDHMTYLQPTITSLYLQILTYFTMGYMQRSINLSQINFNVYKTT